jgi:hypothetical protein
MAMKDFRRFLYTIRPLLWEYTLGAQDLVGNLVAHESSPTQPLVLSSFFVLCGNVADE